MDKRKTWKSESVRVHALWYDEHKKLHRGKRVKITEKLRDNMITCMNKKKDLKQND